MENKYTEQITVALRQTLPIFTILISLLIVDYLIENSNLVMDFAKEYPILFSGVAAILAAYIAHYLNIRREQAKELKTALAKSTILIDKLHCMCLKFNYWESLYSTIIKSMTDNKYTPKEHLNSIIEITKELNIRPIKLEEQSERFDTEIAIASGYLFSLYASFLNQIDELEEVLTNLANHHDLQEITAHQWIVIIPSSITNLYKTFELVYSEHKLLCSRHNYYFNEFDLSKSYKKWEKIDTIISNFDSKK